MGFDFLDRSFFRQATAHYSLLWPDSVAASSMMVNLWYVNRHWVYFDKRQWEERAGGEQMNGGMREKGKGIREAGALLYCSFEIKGMF